jgi:hypothetical protein
MRSSRLLILLGILAVAGTGVAGFLLGRGSRQAGEAAGLGQESLPPLVFVRDGNLWRSDGDGASSSRHTSLCCIFDSRSRTLRPRLD